MTIKEILSTTKHRPWNIPNERWKFYQEWNNAIFLHWQVALHELRKFVPEALEIDLFDGKPWVSVVAFTMEGIRPKNLPPFPPISNFDEINIRTYVKYNGKAGVYFLSIEGGTKLSCRIAKSISELPYRYSKIKRTGDTYKSSNPEFDDRLKIGYSIGKLKNNKTELDVWLTERYALFQDTSRSLNKYEIHHLEWPIHEINLIELHCSYPRFHTLINNRPDNMHYSHGVKVIAWGKKTKKF